MDNLEGQIAEEFKTEVANADDVCWYGLPGATDIWQPVDAGYAELLAHYKWLDFDENADKWYGEDNRFTASERRILITHWVGEAYNALADDKYNRFRREIFERTGCLLTADGSGDNLVRPEGLPDYKVPPTSIIEPTAQLAVSSIPVKMKTKFKISKTMMRKSIWSLNQWKQTMEIFLISSILCDFRTNLLAHL